MKKDVLLPKNKENAKTRWQRDAFSQYNQTPTSLGGGHPQNRKILQRFPHRNESPEPHVMLLSLGVWPWKEKPPEHLALKVSRVGV